MLVGEEAAQRVRHDALGYFIFLEAVKRATNLKAANPELAWLTSAAEPATFFEASIDSVTGKINLAPHLVTSLAGSSPLEMVDSEFRKFLYAPALRKKLPLMLGVGWLVLTHHRLIQPVREFTTEKNSFPAISSRGHINQSIPPAPELNLRTIPSEVPWKQPDWCAAFTRCIEAILSLLTTNPKLPEEFSANNYSTLFASMAFIQRPALIIGDQLTSVMQKDVLERGGVETSFDSNKLYANSVGRQTDAAGDFLHTHLLGVGERSSFAFNMLLNTDEGWMPFVDTSTLLAGNLLQAKPSADSAFHWQQKAVDAIAAIPDIENKPLFAVLLSAPGSGKTIAGPRILDAASKGKFRVTVGLGLKSLTLQTGRSFVDKMGFAERDVAVMVGDKAARLFHEAESKVKVDNNVEFEDKANATQRGSESLFVECEDDFVFAGEQDATRGSWLQALQPSENITTTNKSGVFTKKRERLIDAPIVICTVDHIAHCAELLRTDDAKTVLRIASSDLILDEIDGYSTADLITLGKLVYLHGVYGKRVMLMSGTLPSALSEAFYRNWLKGIQLYQSLRSEQGELPVALLVSNLSTPVVLTGATANDFANASNQFCVEFGSALNKVGSRVWPGILDVTSGKLANNPAWLEETTQAALALHHIHKCTGEESDTFFSAGFVRMNKVASAQALAKHLLNREASAHEPDIRVICYHARYPKLLRAMLEEFLDSAFNRFTNEVPNHALIRKALAESTSKEVLVLVCTTSIEETGRDHDFDFAIVEPSSERSAIQAAGRVLRHRNKQPVAPNFLVMSTTIRGLEGARVPYGGTGIQDNPDFSNTQHYLVDSPSVGGPLAGMLNKANVAFIPGASKLTTRAKDLLPISAWGSRLTPQGALVAPASFEQSRLGTLGYLELLSRLGSNFNIKTSGNLTTTEELFRPEFLHTLEGFRTSGGDSNKEVLWLDARHAKAWPFRANKTERELSVCLDESLNKFKIFDPITGTLSKTTVEHGFVKVNYPERALLRLDLELETRFTQLCAQNKWGRQVLVVLGQGTTRYNPEKVACNKSFTYHPLLGFAKG